jgi:NADPH-dependent curcumin reductase CurA
VSERNRRFLLRERPSGRIGPGTFELVDGPVPEIADGEALVRTQWISLDPASRGWIRDAPSYVPPVGVGEVMRGRGLGRVAASRHPGYPEGQLLAGLVGWQEWTVAREGAPLEPVSEIAGVPASAYLGVLGLTGLTAWVGMTDIARPQPGETVVISAAAGAVGSVAGQIAKRRGARVVGIAGGRDKASLLTERLGFDAAVDHRARDWHEQLVAATPQGVDVDFENVGGEIMDAVFARLNLHARVALCGLISCYNDLELPPGPRNFLTLVLQRVRLQGFIVLDHLDRRGDALKELASWLTTGELKALETVIEGFEQLPTAINMLFDGANVGKLVVHVAED